ncbi:hypothetical protein DFQ27_004670 [Actinomortierella ambigua]|uniref:Striatin N-terminal domain-containing protein n=1 Tax=Actinomortierella ambigua TaxID=1343610 RepID=A0A9P6Q1B8_9FUNG|nr:hypothetical protein DFQ27_004670 [Actinomortierella ambigua]
MHQYQTFTPSPAPSVPEYAFPSVLQFLQSEWRRFERDRNEWDIEKAEMKARIAYLEGEKRGIDNTKMDLMKRIKMLEFALRQERSKYVENMRVLQQQVDGGDNGAPKSNINGSSPPGVATPAHPPLANQQAINKLNRMSTYSNSSQSMSHVSPISATGIDLVGKAKSREFLRICLQEISYLTASVPPSAALAMPPTRQPSIPVNGMRIANHPGAITAAAAHGGRNRNSDFFPAPVPSTQAPPLPRSNSVPIPTLQTLPNIKPAANSPPLEEEPAMPDQVHDKVEDAALDQLSQPPVRPLEVSPTADQRATVVTNTFGAHHPLVDDAASKGPTAASTNATLQHDTQLNGVAKSNNVDSGSNEAVGKVDDEDDDIEEVSNGDADPITVVHSPLNQEEWHLQIQRAGHNLEKKSKAPKAEDEAQLSKDVQSKFNISPEKLNKMVKGWDKSKVEGSAAPKSVRKKKGKDTMLDELANLTINVKEAENGSADAGDADSSAKEPPRWRPKVCLRRHMDTVRSIAFHPANKALLSGSEDGTMKYWSLESSLKASRKSLNSEVDPIHTYRGHTGAVNAVALSADQGKVFSASTDSTVRAWKLVPMDKETYSRTDPSIHVSTFIGHTDAVWDIRLFPLSISSTPLLASISADGALKIWDTETKGSPLRSSWGYHGMDNASASEPTLAYTSGLSGLPVPTSLDFCPTDLKKLVVSYSNSVMKLFDIETGKEILKFKSDESYDGTKVTQINRVICHPTMPMAISGHEDRFIRFFDINSGNCTFSMLAHTDAVSSLDIDPSGLVLCSGGHDASIRYWDIVSTQTCLQEFTGHRRKGDEGVCDVKYHPSLPGVMASAGADSVVKVYNLCGANGGVLELDAKLKWSTPTSNRTPRFPTRRVGESKYIVIFRTIITLIVQFVFWFQKPGQIRPRTISLRGSSYVAPIDFNITVNAPEPPVSNTVIPAKEGVDENGVATIGIPSLGPFLLSARGSEPDYMRMVVDCDPLGLDDWYQILLDNPLSTSDYVTTELFSNVYFFRPGFTIEIRFSPLNFTYVDGENASRWDHFRMFFGFDKKKIEYTYISRISQIPFGAQEEAVYNATSAVFIFRPDNDLARSKTGSPLITLKDTVAKIGGVVSAAGAFLVFLFGVNSVSPWGILAQIPYFRRKITKNLSFGYNQWNGMSRGPFTEFTGDQTGKEIDFDEVTPSGHSTSVNEKLSGARQPQQSPWNLRVGVFDAELEEQDAETKIRYLKERLDELEIVLADFYLDTQVFQDFANSEANKLAPGLAHRIRAAGTSSRVAVNKLHKVDEKGTESSSSSSPVVLHGAHVTAAGGSSPPPPSFHSTNQTHPSGDHALQGVTVDGHGGSGNGGGGGGGGGGGITSILGA